MNLNEEIDRGSYGVVKKVSVYGINCAAKDIHDFFIKYSTDKEFKRIKKNFLEECIKCSKLFHPNIVQFIGIYYPSKKAKLPWIVMELMNHNLAGFVEKYSEESISLFIKASIFCDISLGIQFLHARNIIHRDLSSKNILLTKHLTAKIADLGVAKKIDPNGSNSHSVVPGTKDFLPPEVVSDSATNTSHYEKPIDIFSLGCIMIHVVTQKWPSPLPETYYDEKLKKKVVLSEIDRREAYLKQIQKLSDLKEIIEKCLHDGPKVRPTAIEMVNKLQMLKFFYQKTSELTDDKVNAVEFEKHLRLRDNRLSEQQLEIEKLSKVIEEAHKHLQVRFTI